MQDFQGKTAVVTGAASGIGLASAKAFASAGMCVALLDLRAAALEAAVEQVRGLGARAIGVVTDVSKRASMDAAAQAIDSAFGATHLLMNNAGVFIRGQRMEDITDEAWNWILGVNLYGVLHGIQVFVPRIRAHGGHVVNTCSISGLIVGARQTGAYSASKFAVLAVSEALAHDLEGSGVGVSVSIPGAVNTNIYVTSAEHRGAIGGPNVYATTPPDIAAGMSPDEVARRMIKGVRAGELYIPIDPDTRPLVETRHADIIAAFDRAGAR